MTATPLVVVVSATDPPSAAATAWAQAAEPLARVVRCPAEPEPLARQLADRDRGAPVLLVLAPEVEGATRLAAPLARKRLVDHLLFVATPAEEASLQQALSYSGLPVPWTVARDGDGDPAQLLSGLLRSVRQRTRFRSTLDRINLQLQQPPDPTAYRHLVVSSRYMESILRHASDAIFSLDATGVVLTWNDGSAALFGLSERDAVGRPILDLAEWPEPRLREALHAALAGTAQRLELDAHAAGRPIAVEMTLTPVEDEAGAVIGTAAIVRDIGERRRHEREREQVLEAERAARTGLEQAARMKDEFLAVLSHELKTPLSAMLGFAAVLQRSAGGSPEVTRAAEAIVRNGRAQVRLIDDLLDMSAIRAGKLRLDMDTTSLGTIAAHVVESLQPAAAHRGIVLELQATDDASVHGDPQRLAQVLSNLLNNALKFSGPGTRVRTTVRRLGEVVEVAVTDQGEGIGAEFLAQVFDRFAQEDASMRRRHGGLGLGLSIARQLVELHGGSIRADSPGPGLGATFTVTLPAAAAIRADGERPGTEPPPDLEGLRVLIVDDEPDARDVLSMMMSSLGAEFRTAAGVDEGLALLENQPFDLLLSDISMPGRNGYELVRSLRATPEHRRLPAIAVTAFGRAEDRKEALDCGYDAHVPKPVEVPALLRAIQQVVPPASRRAACR